MNTADQAFVANMTALHNQAQVMCQDCMDNGEDCTDIAGQLMGQSEAALDALSSATPTTTNDVMNAVIRGSYTPWE